MGRAKTVVQLCPRGAESTLESTTLIKAICDYRQIEVRDFLCWAFSEYAFCVFIYESMNIYGKMQLCMVGAHLTSSSYCFYLHLQPLPVCPALPLQVLFPSCFLKCLFLFVLIRYTLIWDFSPQPRGPSLSFGMWKMSLQKRILFFLLSLQRLFSHPPCLVHHILRIINWNWISNFLDFLLYHKKWAVSFYCWHHESKALQTLDSVVLCTFVCSPPFFSEVKWK